MKVVEKKVNERSAFCAFTIFTLLIVYPLQLLQEINKKWKENSTSKNFKTAKSVWELNLNSLLFNKYVHVCFVANFSNTKVATFSSYSLSVFNPLWSCIHASCECLGLGASLWLKLAMVHKWYSLKIEIFRHNLITPLLQIFY